MALVKTYVDDTTAVLTWRTVDHPHEFSSYDRYEISCFKCEEGGDSLQHHCTEQCGENVRYWPGKEGLKDNHVTVSELQPSTLYKFVLFVWNSQTALASVLVETSIAPKAKGKLIENFIRNIPKKEIRKKKERKKFVQIYANTAQGMLGNKPIRMRQSQTAEKYTKR